MSQIPSEWQLQDAKNKLSQLVREARKGAPQYITVHGQNAAVIISAQEYAQLTRSQTTLSSALLEPLLGDNEELFARNTDVGRDLGL